MKNENHNCDNYLIPRTYYDEERGEVMVCGADCPVCFEVAVTPEIPLSEWNKNNFEVTNKRSNQGY
jgi:hypothetical protein